MLENRGEFIIKNKIPDEKHIAEQNDFEKMYRDVQGFNSSSRSSASVASNIADAESCNKSLRGLLISMLKSK